MNLSDAYKNRTTKTKKTKTVYNSTLLVTCTRGGGTVSAAEAFAFSDSNGVWWITGYAKSTLPSGDICGITFGSSNVVFEAATEQTCSCFGSYSPACPQGLTAANGSVITAYGCGTNAANYVCFNFTLKLKQEPTWAAANLDN